MQGRSESTSSVAFEVLIIINCEIDFINLFIFNYLTSNITLFLFNCSTSSINLFNFNCLTSNFCFPKNISFANRRKRLFMDARPYFHILNSFGKMITCFLRDTNKVFEVPHPAHEYTKMRIPNKTYRTNTARTLRGTGDASATSTSV